jgi:hypothetical protein
MNDPGPPPPENDFTPAASGTPSAYHDVGLIPPAGPARTWGLTVVGVPLLLLLLLSLIGSGLSHAGSGQSGSDWTGTSGWPGTSDSTDDATDSTDTAPAEPYDPTTGPGTTTGGVGDGFGATPTPTPSDTDTDTAATGPEAVVTAYFAAINSGDYATAWSLGGKNLDSDYDTFVAGFATTQSDTISITSVQGDDVRVALDALQTDGTTKSFDNTYTVSGGEITSAQGTQTS